LLLLKGLCQHFPLGGADLVEVAPFIGAQYSQSSQLEPANTLENAAQIVDCLVGKF
jgi:hypothetical protein